MNQELIKDLLSDCEKLIQAAEDLELPKIARINDVPVENLKVVRDALEKRIFEKPHIWGDGYADGEMVYDMYDCPDCGESYEIDEQYNCCPNCGQAIDWRNWEEGKEDDKEKRRKKYIDIVVRATVMEFVNEDDFTDRMKDIESADEKFNLRLDDWLEADDISFAHDFFGIRDNINREAGFPSTDFGSFIPEFAGKSKKI